MLRGLRNEALLSDFGIATVSHSYNPSSSGMAGTIPYMAPEQIQGKPRSASDQYALGIVVYEWLSGDYPFHGSFSEIASQHILVPPPLREKLPTILPAIEEVVLKALAKQPEDRFEVCRLSRLHWKMRANCQEKNIIQNMFPVLSGSAIISQAR